MPEASDKTASSDLLTLNKQQLWKLLAGIDCRVQDSAYKTETIYHVANVRNKFGEECMANKATMLLHPAISKSNQMLQQLVAGDSLLLSQMHNGQSQHTQGPVPKQEFLHKLEATHDAFVKQTVRACTELEANHYAFVNKTVNATNELDKKIDHLESQLVQMGTMLHNKQIAAQKATRAEITNLDKQTLILTTTMQKRYDARLSEITNKQMTSNPVQSTASPSTPTVPCAPLNQDSLLVEAVTKLGEMKENSARALGHENTNTNASLVSVLKASKKKFDALPMATYDRELRQESSRVRRTILNCLQGHLCGVPPSTETTMAANRDAMTFMSRHNRHVAAKVAASMHATSPTPLEQRSRHLGDSDGFDI